MTCPDCNKAFMGERCSCGFRPQVIKLTQPLTTAIDTWVGVGRDVLGNLYQAIHLIGTITLLRERQGKVVMGDLPPDGYKEKEQKLHQDLGQILRLLSDQERAELAEKYPHLVKGEGA